MRRSRIHSFALHCIRSPWPAVPSMRGVFGHESVKSLAVVFEESFYFYSALNVLNLKQDLKHAIHSLRKKPDLSAKHIIT